MTDTILTTSERYNEYLEIAQKLNELSNSNYADLAQSLAADACNLIYLALREIDPKRAAVEE